MAKKLKNEPLSLKFFFHHFIRNLVLGLSIMFVLLLVGMVGTRYFENANWVDSFTNAAMIVSGVGTLDNPQTNAGKIFIAVYSIVGGASFILVIAIVFTPIFHWLSRQVKVEDK